MSVVDPLLNLTVLMDLCFDLSLFARLSLGEGLDPSVVIASSSGLPRASRSSRFVVDRVRCAVGIEDGSTNLVPTGTNQALPFRYILFSCT